MKLTERKTVQGYMKDIRAEFKKGCVLRDLVENSDIGSLEAVKKANPELVKAAVAYIKYAEKKVQQGYVPLQYGKVMDSCEERKDLQKAFTLDTPAKIQLFRPDWWMCAEELFIYNLLEAVFDASLLVEQGAARKFEELVSLYRTFTKVEEVDGWVFAWYDKSVLFINTNKGCIYRADNRALREKIAKSRIKEIKRVKECHRVVYELRLVDGQRFPLMTDQCLTSGAWSVERILKDTKKEYYQIHLKDRDNITGRPAVQFPAHILLLLARFGINTIKHTILKDSLITCDHLDMTGSNNILSNLQLVTRRDNCLRAKSKDPFIQKTVYAYDLGEFWQYVEQSYSVNKIDLRMKKESIAEYWENILKEKSVEDILIA